MTNSEARHLGYTKMVIRLDEERGKRGLKVIKIEGVREKDKKVIVRREIVCSKWKSWNDGNLSRRWNKKYSVW